VTWIFAAWLACRSVAEAPAPPPAASPGTPAAQAPAAQAPAADPLPAGWLERVVGSDDPHAELPMVVMVHGLGDRPQSMLSVLGGLPGPVRIIAPRAPHAWGRGHAWFTERARTGDLSVLEAQMQASAEAFVADLAAAQRARPTTGKPVLAGFSQGGMMSFMVATHHPDAIAKAVPVAGWLPEGLWPDGPAPADAPPIVALHGTADPVLPLGPTAEAVDALRAQGWSVQLRTFDGVEHRIPPPVRDALYAELAPGR